MSWPRSFASAFVTLSLATLATRGRAGEAIDEPSTKARIPVVASFGAYAGGLAGTQAGTVLGIDAVVAFESLRVGGSVETSSFDLHGRYLLGAAGVFGVGVTSSDGAIDGMVGLEGGVHTYRGVGNGSERRPNGEATLLFGGARASVEVRFGDHRRFGLGLLGFARSDFGQRAAYAAATATEPRRVVGSVGEQSVGAALRFGVTF
ncbi:MAG: hypothetical protein JNL79_07600 [Myxococcales bacterium]|nr:hypothetical protein [Myxococcales bacterium]